jgi:hypothetical protein
VRQVKDFFWSIVGNIAANFLWIPISTSVIPLLGVGAAYWLRVLDARWVSVAFGFGWFATWFATTVWYKNNRTNTHKRMVTLGSVMYLSDVALRRILLSPSSPSNARQFSEDEIRYEIKQLIVQMCSIVAYRLEGSLKGATFLLYHPSNDPTHDGRFELFAEHNHPSIGVAPTIQERVKLHGSLAGQVIREGRLIACRDCNNPKKGVEWINTTEVHGYVSRTVAPVYRTNATRRDYIGVLCFDVKKPWTITKEEEDIINLLADKIGQLWSFYK